MSHLHLMAELEQLVSEARNPNSMSIDLLPTEEILRVMNRDDALVPEAVAKVIPQIAEAVEEIVRAFRSGGRLIYIGAGTSARLGVLDASECPPTFSVPEGMVVGLIAGGPRAILHAVEGAEDDVEEGKRNLAEINLSANDVVVGIAVSGRTPYVVGALTYAQSIGAKTVSLTCNPHSNAGRHRRYRHLAGRRAGGGHRLDTVKIRHGPEARLEHADNRQHDPHRQDL